MPEHRQARLAQISLPEFDLPVEMPELPAELYQDRFHAFIKRLQDTQIDHCVIYADREHSANLAWLTGFDPRFEEALLIVSPGRNPVLLTGPENQGTATSAPLSMDVQLYPPMGLMGQDRRQTVPLGDILVDAGIGNGKTVGVCGWKYFSPQEHDDPQRWIEIPAYIVDTLRHIIGPKGKVFNAGSLFMDAGQGLRVSLPTDELARFEFAACHTSESVKRLIHNTRPGMREFDAFQFLKPIGIPLSCHTMFSTGARAWQGLVSPSSRTIERGDAVTTAYGVQGALNCRAGWITESADELEASVRDYVDVLVAPYFEAIAEWLETIEIGLEGGALDGIIRRRLGNPFFGINLNPGHLIHLDEWMNTPIIKGGTTRLRSGMALQVDVIPATGGPYFTTNIEDGIALLDEAGRAEFSEKYPKAMTRIQQRRAFMADQLGIHLKPDCLPFSNIAGWLPPFWLSPDQAMTMR